MANRRKRLRSNAKGEFFVDHNCIDCGTCRWMAPENFDAFGAYARVYKQPCSENEIQASLQAAVACPVGAIGGGDSSQWQAAAKRFPVEIQGNVFHCGFHHRSSYGASSYLIVRREGNVLVDSPRFSKPLIQRLEDLGGVALMFLSHRDDVAEHERFAEHFGCDRILHHRDVTGHTATVEHQITGDATYSIDEQLLMIPVPGHTPGSACLLYNNRFLFTGDHLAWSASMGQLYAFRDACWFSWDRQIDSMKRLAQYTFEYVLPGHGAPGRIAPEASAQEVHRCTEWMTR